MVDGCGGWWRGCDVCGDGCECCDGVCGGWDVCEMWMRCGVSGGREDRGDDDDGEDDETRGDDGECE